MIQKGVNIFNNSGEIAQSICSFLSHHVKRKNFTIALPGGNTPREIFELMSKNSDPSVRWDHIQFFWGDERCVGPLHSDSNYRMAYESLLVPLNIPPASVHRIIGENDPGYEADRYTVEVLKNVSSHDGFVSFNLIILGMGDDGHTASIFPGQESILKSTRICDTTHHPTSGQTRITLTLETINHAEFVFFLVTGEKKADLIAQIIGKTGKWSNYPSAMVSPLSGELCWLLDKPAASAVHL